MRFSSCIASQLAVLSFTSLVWANSNTSNAGIFSPDGKVLPAPAEPAVAGRSGAVAYRAWSKTKETNFERMRRGLPPLAPTRRRSGIRPRISPSPDPCTVLLVNTGYIKVTRDGNDYAYISKTLDGQKSFTKTATGQLDSTALTVTLPVSPFGGPFDITATGSDPSYTLVGAVGGSGGYNFQPNNLGYAYLAATGHTPANTPPSSTAGTSIQSLGYNGPSESQIWSLDCQTLELTAQWTDSDSSQSPTSFFYDGAVDFLGLVGDTSKFAASFPGEGVVFGLKFFFVPVETTVAIP
ncbi:hypothetical protein DFH06DRAFT_97888 [Mycena polygramma]|nr:hypothetical protein DFH06DRAFT_97888 [Mycena polygramma]